ncbi:hypothetical protein ADUPG1_011228, partial [Aduncisulcus paluster]
MTQNGDIISTFKDVLSHDYFFYSSTSVSDTGIEVSINNTPFASHSSGFTTNLSVDKALFPHQYSTHDEGVYHQHSLLPQPLRGLLLLFLVAALSITLVVIGLVVRMRSSIPTILIFLVVLSLSFQSVLCDGYLSNECSMYISEDDHLECNEVYPGRYAAECEEGYYYDQGEYSCFYDTNTDCPSDMNDNQMCVKTADGDVITSDCRSAWYGDDCNQLYSVHIPDTLFRGKVCDAISNSDPLCDVTEFEMAGINVNFYSYESHITTFEGAQSEDDTDYWTFITTVFPIHSSTVKDNAFIPNSCALNNVDDYVCDSGTYPTKCPSIVLNEVYNSVADPPVKECAFIAKSSDGKCYTVHDDYIRQYLVANCLSGGTNDLDSGIISVATMRSVLSCPLDANSNESLSLPDIASAASLSSVNSITTLQGLEYATSLTSLTLDGYDLSGDINSNAEYDKLVVQILAKAVTSGTIDSGLRILSASGCGLSAISDVLDLTP